MFVTSLIWQPNYYAGGSSVLRGILNGWSISPIVTLRSGQPFTLLNGVDANQDGVSNTDRAQLLPGQNPVLEPHRPRSQVIAQWFNTAAFQRNLATPGVVIDGNSPRNFLDGPGTRNVDLALAREFKFRELFALQSRVEAKNAFNMVNLGEPNRTAGGNSFGTITRAQPMRQLQRGLRLTF